MNKKIKKIKHRYLKNIQQSLSPNQKLNQVVEHGMCIGCGLCQSIAGTDKVELGLVQNGTDRPILKADMDHATIEKIIDVCPGTRIEGLPESLVDSDSHYDEVWGIWRNIVLAWSAEPEIRHLGSTGGVLTGLALYLLEAKEVDFIVHATASSRNPIFGERFVSRNRDDVIQGAGSRYAPTATLIDIVQILDQCEKTGERFAFIGTPCDVTGLRNLARHDQRVDGLCKYQLAMVCGGFMSPPALNAFLETKDVTTGTIKSLRYRGFGCPGSTRVETTDGAVKEINYVDFWGKADSNWQLPFRCKICADGIGDAADIAVSDTWQGGAPELLGQEKDPGTNAALVRSLAGQQLLNSAVEAGYINLGEQVTPRNMDQFQPHQKLKKESVWSRFVGMRIAGNVVPDVRGLRLKPLAKTNSLSENLAQARGARDRCRGGKNKEATPVAMVENTNEDAT